eukprot:TRINITY_DN4547_c0_g1_i1.p1 TRINITY_DN4547_c0_g1~~TRINITY_DN4547_c0_g1_i1.p1  ORF type:complete len:233 (+),score=80.88 TRINITY_DN4547_c0_g1_i1:76-774(+)
MAPKKKRKKAKAAQAKKVEAVEEDDEEEEEEEEEVHESPKKAAKTGNTASSTPAASSSNLEKRPNILVTGTPGVGKTKLSAALAAAGMTHIEVSKLITEKKLYSEWDDEMNCSIFDEDMVCDALEPLLEQGNCVVDFHSAGCFPEDWFDLYIVLRAETNVLGERLEKRRYSEAKIKGNIEAEIFQTCLEEVREATDGTSALVWELPHNTPEDMDACVSKLKSFLAERGVKLQ